MKIREAATKVYDYLRAHPTFAWALATGAAGFVLGAWWRW